MAIWASASARSLGTPEGTFSSSSTALLVPDAGAMAIGVQGLELELACYVSQPISSKIQGHDILPCYVSHTSLQHRGLLMWKHRVERSSMFMLDMPCKNQESGEEDRI